MSAKETQVNGDHYRKGGIQPIEYIHANGMDFMTGNIIKYATRWRFKGQALSDLRKVIHYAELLIEAEGLDTKYEATDALKHSEAQPAEGYEAPNSCGFCECEPGRCLSMEFDDAGAYAAWMDQMTHPDAKPVDVTTLPGYETR